MCVIVAKPSNVAVPGRDLLQRCFNRNPDGAGMMYPLGTGQLRILKGFPTWEAFDAALTETETRADLVALPLVMHFRIGTHGSKRDPKHTHPFPVCASYEEMERLDVETPLAMAHNGIIKFGRVGSDRSIVGDGPSDSMEFAKMVLHPLSRIEGWLDDVDINNIVDGALGGTNKLVVMEGDGRIVWFGPRVEHVGCWWSNSSFEEPKPVATPVSYSGWAKGSPSTYWDNASKVWDGAAKQGELWSKWKSPAEKVSEFIAKYYDTGSEMQRMLDLANKGWGGGYDEVLKEKLVWFRRPAKVTVRDKVTKKQLLHEVFDPMELYYIDPDGRHLYLLDFEEDILYRLGDVVELNDKPSLHHVVGRKKDFRKSRKFAELFE